MKLKSIMNSNIKAVKPAAAKVRKDKVISIRVPSKLADQYEIRCLENNQTMTEPLRQALNEYLN